MKVASFNRWFRVVGLMLLGCFAASSAVAADKPQPLVPGTGQRVVQVGDDFEDEKWEYYPNLPKSSENIDDAQRLPGGIAKNGAKLDKKVYSVPQDIDRAVAQIKLEAMRVHIDKLTAEQESATAEHESQDVGHAMRVLTTNVKPVW